MFKFFFALSLLLSQNGEAKNFSVEINPELTAFRRVGNVVDGVAHAHLAFRFNLTQEEAVVYELRDEINAVTRNTSTQLWAPTLHRIAPLAQDWERFRKQLVPADRRDKRQAVVMGVAAGGLIVSAGLGIWAAHETQVLSTRMDGVDGDIDRLFVAVNSSVKLETHIVEEVSTLKTAMRDILNTVGELTQFLSVSEAAHALFHRLQQRLAGFEAILAHRLLPSFLAEKEMNEYYEGLVHNVHKAGFELVSKGMEQLFQEKVTYVVKGDILIVFVHVPVFAAHSHRELDLYEHLHLPILDNANVPKVIRGSTSFLALDVEKELFIELTPNDLESCTRSGHDFSCSFVFPRLRGGDTSCLPALFLHHVEAARKWCQQETIREDFKFFRINSTAFLFQTKQKTTINVLCGQQLVAEQVTGLALVNIAPDCIASTDEMTFTAEEGHLPDDLHVVVAAPALSGFFTEGSNISWPLLPPNEELENEAHAVEEDLRNAQEKRKTPLASSYSTRTILFCLTAALLLLVGLACATRKLLSDRQARSHSVSYAKRQNKDKAEEEPKEDLTRDVRRVSIRRIPVREEEGGSVHDAGSEVVITLI